MGRTTEIEWCDHSWSPWRGCTKVSPGCANCYAETLSKRNPAVRGQWGRGKPRVLAKNWGDPVKWDRQFAKSFGLELDHRRPTVFPSLCDWLDEEVPVEWLARFLQLIHDTPNLNWLLLTKRPENWEQRLRDVCVYFQGLPGDWRQAPAWQLANRWCPHNGVHRFDPPANVWVGTSVEDQTRADERIPALLRIPAVGRFVSVEPLLGPVDLYLSPSVRCRHCDNYVGGHATGCHDICDCRIHWVIIGGESGHGARPCNVDWIRSLVRQCRSAGVAPFVKQLGARAVEADYQHTRKCWNEDCALAGGPEDCTGEVVFDSLELGHPKGGDPAEWPADLRVREFPEGMR